MNYQSITAIVRSADGIDFAVSTDQRAVPYELAFARARHSDELSSHTDFVRVSAPLTEARSMEYELEYSVAPEPQDETAIERPWRSMDDLPIVSASTKALVRRHVQPIACDPPHEALCRAQARWRTAAVINGDKTEQYSDGDEPEELQ